MLIVAQAGLGAAGSAVGAFVYIFTVSVFALVALTVAWCSLPTVMRLISDLIRQRDALAESEADRRMDGRLFTVYRDPEYPTRKK